MGFSQVNLISMVEERKQREKEAKKLEEEKQKRSITLEYKSQFNHGNEKAKKKTVVQQMNELYKVTDFES